MNLKKGIFASSFRNELIKSNNRNIVQEGIISDSVDIIFQLFLSMFEIIYLSKSKEWKKSKKARKVQKILQNEDEMYRRIQNRVRILRSIKNIKETEKNKTFKVPSKANNIESEYIVRLATDKNQRKIEIKKAQQESRRSNHNKNFKEYKNLTHNFINSSKTGGIDSATATKITKSIFHQIETGEDPFEWIDDYKEEPYIDKTLGSKGYQMVDDDNKYSSY